MYWIDRISLSQYFVFVYLFKGRSLSLVGENERNLLKDILKTCKVPAKMRIIPQGK